jgi:hypothetical protein
MTACAMTVGMVPMALALEEGSQMQAPLGRAVIGGLVMSTFATLLVVPSIFAVVVGRKTFRSPSIYPDDPESAHYDPLVFVDKDEGGERGKADEKAALKKQDGDEVLGFLREILDDARSKRDDMVTHYTVDDLRAALGFESSAGNGQSHAAEGSGSPGAQGETGKDADEPRPAADSSARLSQGES